MLIADLPKDIVFDILYRLPIRSLLELSCVSQSWRSLFSNPDFVQYHLQKSLICKNRERVLLKHFPLQSLNYNSPEGERITDLHPPLLNPGTRLTILGSCNGLVCLLIGFGESVILYNPATRKYRSFQVPRSPWPLRYAETDSWSWVSSKPFRDPKRDSWGFFFDSSLQEYKLVRYVWAPSKCVKFRVQVFRLAGSDQATVCREVSCPYYIKSPRIGFFFFEWIDSLANASLWRGRGGDYIEDVILRFDLAREVFDEMPIPVDECCGLCLLEGCLSLLDDDKDHHMVWVMKEYGIRASWTLLLVIPRNINPEYEFCFAVVTMKSDREILLHMDCLSGQVQELVIFDVQEGTYETIRAARWPVFYDRPTVYVESLVSP